MFTGQAAKFAHFRLDERKSLLLAATEVLQPKDQVTQIEHEVLSLSIRITFVTRRILPADIWVLNHFSILRCPSGHHLSGLYFTIFKYFFYYNKLTKKKKLTDSIEKSFYCTNFWGILKRMEFLNPCIV